MWDDRGYYYRSVRVGRRVRREYVGTGPVADLAAEADALARADRLARVAARKERQAEAEALDRPLAELDERATLLVHAALLAAGYHQHKRQWRLRRVRPGETG